MIQVDAEVRQLRSDKTFVNVKGRMEGGIAVWGHAYQCPTYLLIARLNWEIVTFDDEAWRDEALPELVRNWNADKVLELPTLEDVTGRWLKP